MLTTIAISVLSSSFLGSIHCMGMCGPIVLMTNKTILAAIFYHFGRLLSYLLLGSIAGLLGQQILGQFPHSLTAFIAPLTLGSIFIYLGYMLLRHQRFHLPLPRKWSRPYAHLVGLQSQQTAQSLKHSFFIGLLSITLPCGWVYGFVIGAAATKSLVTSLVIMAMFWLGTLPVLFITPMVFQKFIRPVKDKFPVVASVILILAGVLIIATGVRRIF